LHVCNCIESQAMAIIGTPLFAIKVKFKNCRAFPLVFGYVFDVVCTICN
jgi:hypothetical protein